MSELGREDELAIADWLRSGDERGVVAVLERFGGQVMVYLERRFPSFDEPERHDTLVDAVLALRETFDVDRGSLGAWLLFLAHQRAVQRLRGLRRGAWLVSVEDVVARDESAEEVLIHDEQRAAVERALESLSTLERGVIEADLEAGAPAKASVLAVLFRTTERSIYNARIRARQKLAGRLRGVFPNLDQGGPVHDG